MQTYCLSCRKHTNTFGSRKVTMANKVIRDKLKYANCMADKSSFLKQKHNKKGSWDSVILKLLIC